MRKSRKLLKWLATGVLALAVLLLLFVVAFVFNPLEGDLRDIRDIVPREVDFYLRKTDLGADFGDGRSGLQLKPGEVPKPVFWPSLVDSRAWSRLDAGPVVSGLRADYAGVLQQAVDGLRSVETDSAGFLDLARDLVGEEVVVAGYFEDRAGAAPRPLAQPWWCAYLRVSWRVRAAWGLIDWSMVQNAARDNGVELTADGDLLQIALARTGETFFAARHLDCLMIGNSRHLLEQSLGLAAGVESEEPFGQSSKYSKGVIEQVDRWEEATRNAGTNRLEFSISTNSIDGFRRFAQRWPDADNRDSMNERVMANFVNLKGWNSISGALLFEKEKLTTVGEVVLNSREHTGFQDRFYESEKQQRTEWLDPFLRMVPEDACAAAALRVSPGDFLNAMFTSLLKDEQELLDDALRRCMFQGQQLTRTADLIERLQIAFLPRTGFVFRRNKPDPQIAVTARSPVPQIAWVFWLRPGSDLLAEALVDMLRNYAPVFKFDPVYHLQVEGLPDPVTEFCNPQIPGTGEIATIVVREFFVVSNSGPLVKDILRTYYRAGNLRQLLETDEYQRYQRELPAAINGFVWLRGRNLIPVLEDYRRMSESQNQMPDNFWMQQNRARAEEVVRADKFSRWPTKAAMPRDIVEGEFKEAVTAYLLEQWNKAASGLSSADLPTIEQFIALAEMIDVGMLEVELQSNYIQFLGKLVCRW